MADSDQTVGSLGIVQRWKNFTGSIYARTMAAILYGNSTGGTEQIIGCTTGGALYTQAQASTASIGILGGSTEVIGAVGGNTVLVTVNLAPTTSAAYAANQLIGSALLSVPGVFRSTSAHTGLLQSAVLVDNTTQNAGINLALFGTNTTGTTYTNGSSFSLAKGDLPKLLGVVSLSASNYQTFSTNAVNTAKGIGLSVNASTGTGLFMAAIAEGTPSYATTGDLAVVLGFQVD